MKTLQKLGVPYTDDDIEKALKQMERDAKRIADRIQTDLKEEIPSDTEVIALIAYMQKLGKDIKWRDQ